jgi:hypothetical protein
MKVIGQEKIVGAGKKNSNLFKEPTGCPIAEILKVISLFPSYISLEMNNALQEDISEKVIVSYPFIVPKMQNSRARRPNNRFCLGFFETIKGTFSRW